MDFQTYQRAALRTESTTYQPIDPRLLHAAYGIVTEAGELLDAIKKATFYGKPLDTVNVAEEIGDLMWYIAIACDALATDLGDIMDRNIAKLRTRYPDKFTTEAATNRDLDAERKTLES